jgi:hypothetical protein
MNTRILVTLFLVILIGWGLIYTETTDADLSAELVAESNSFEATTLEFSNRDTANETRANSLFNTSGLLPTGFDVRAVRIKKDGKENFKYSLTVQKTFGDDSFCNELYLEVWHKGKSQYNDKLLNFNTNSSLENQDKDDWIFFISLPKNDKNLSLKFCEFEFKFSTFHNNPNETGGLSDQESLKNRITSGSW